MSEDRQRGETKESFLSEFKGYLPVDLPTFKSLKENEELKSVLSKSVFWSTFSALGGCSLAYIEGQAVFFPLYFYSGMGFAYSALYFGTEVRVRSFRGVSDVYNHVGAGVFTFSVIGTAMHGLKRGARSGVVGAGLGALYWYSSGYLYDKLRQSWLEYRRLMVHRSEDNLASIADRVREPPTNSE